MNTQQASHSTSRGNVLALYHTLQSYGVDPEPILSEVGLEVSELTVEGRIGADAMDHLILRALEETGDPCFGIRFVDALQPTSFHALGVALLYSTTLRSFCQRLARYFTMITSMDEIAFIEEGGKSYLSADCIYDYSEPVKHVSCDAWCGYILKLLRLILLPDFSPLRIDLTWEPPAEELARYQAIFRCPVGFDSKDARVYLDPATLDDLLPSSNAELARQNDLVVAEFLARTNKADLPSLVHMKMIELMASGQCNREQIARSLELTVRTLHNRLEKAGTSYKQLLEQTRRELAQDYLRKQQHSISDIAYLLGYTDVGNFSRAFKRWTGVSPKQYMKTPT